MLLFLLLLGVLSSCMMTHSVRSARLLREGETRGQSDARVQLNLIDASSDLSTDASRAVASQFGYAIMTGGIVSGGLADLYVEHGYSDDVTLRFRIGFGSGSLGVDAMVGLLAGTLAVSVAGAVWYQPIADHAVGGRVAVLTAYGSRDIDLLVNVHYAPAFNSQMHMLGGAIGLDFKVRKGIGYRPMVEYSVLPGYARDVSVLSFVLGMTMR